MSLSREAPRAPSRKSRKLDLHPIQCFALHMLTVMGLALANQYAAAFLGTPGLCLPPLRGGYARLYADDSIRRSWVPSRWSTDHVMRNHLSERAADAGHP